MTLLFQGLLIFLVAFGIVAAVWIVMRRRRTLGVVSSVIEDQEQLLFGIMASREARPWMQAELEVVVPLPAVVITSLLQAGRNRLVYPTVQRGYMRHPVTDQEVEVYRLTPHGLRLYPAMEPLAQSWDEAIALAVDREREHAQELARQPQRRRNPRLRDIQANRR